MFISARGTVGKVALAQTDMAMSQSCYALIAKPTLNQLFLYLALVDAVEQFRSRAVGSVFNAIVRNTFRSIPIVVPDAESVRNFTNFASPIFGQMEILSNERRNAAQIRDLLLPRLMNGTISPD